MVWVGPEVPEGGGRQVLRKRGEHLEVGVVRAVEEGKPLHGELVTLKAREEPHLFDVEVVHDARPKQRTDARASEGRSGPARVASEEYRRGWSRLFAKKALPS